MLSQIQVSANALRICRVAAQSATVLTFVALARKKWEDDAAQGETWTPKSASNETWNPQTVAPATWAV